MHLVTASPDLDAKIRFVPPILLDNIAVQLGDWSGYHLLAQHLDTVKFLYGFNCEGFNCEGSIDVK